MHKKSTLLRVVLCIGLCLTAIYLYNALAKEKTMRPHTIEIRPGISGKEFKEQYPSIFRDARNANGEIVFYEIHWSTENRGEVMIRHGQHTFTIPYALSILATEMPKDYPDAGLTDFIVNGGLSNTAKLTHEEALNNFYQLLSVISNAGWQRYIRTHLPRIKGKQSFMYAQEKDLYPIDHNYKPSIEEWGAIDMFPRWEFYADGVYLDVTMMREFNEPYKKSGYFISYTFTSRNEWQRLHFQGEKARNTWETAYPKLRKELLNSRKVIEEKIRQEGRYVIDELYVNPDEE
jgi:hypothetical protein